MRLTPGKPRSLKRGRPHKISAEARCKRVVTFVTELEEERLKDFAIDEDRSLSFVVHRIIAQGLERIK